MAKSSNKISLADLTTSGVMIEVDSNFVQNDDDVFDEVKRMEHLCVDALGETDNDEPFETLLNKMEPLFSDKIHKRIIQKGEGDNLNDYARVTVHYNAYIENDAMPFDSTYARGRPRRFTTCNGEVIPGLDLAVQSMKLHEISQFLIHPSYAYGKGFGKIPPNSTILFVVELLHVVDSGYVNEYTDLNEEDQKQFQNVYKYCQSLSERGKDYFKQSSIDSAIKDYNIALTALEDAIPLTQDDLRNQYNLKMKLYSNLLICYAKNKQWNKGITIGEKAMNFCQNNEISGKLLYNFGRCLRQKGDFSKAHEILIKALLKLPKDVNISNELSNLKNEMLKDKENKTNLGKALLN